jgi:hypothetical protein
MCCSNLPDEFCKPIRNVSRKSWSQKRSHSTAENEEWVRGWTSPRESAERISHDVKRSPILLLGEIGWWPFLKLTNSQSGLYVQGDFADSEDTDPRRSEPGFLYIDVNSIPLSIVETFSINQRLCGMM